VTVVLWSLHVGQARADWTHGARDVVEELDDVSVLRVALDVTDKMGLGGAPDTQEERIKVGDDIVRETRVRCSGNHKRKRSPGRFNDLTMCLELGDTSSAILLMDGGEMAVRRVDDPLTVSLESEAGDCFGELSAIGGLMGGLWGRGVNVGGRGETLVELVAAGSARLNRVTAVWRAAYRIAIRDDVSVEDVDIDVAVRDLYTVYKLAEVDMGDSRCRIRVRVLSDDI
jgi:hypothetical protein